MKRTVEKIFIALFMLFMGTFFTINAKAADDISVKYFTHVENNGWMTEVKDGALSGTEGEAKRLEAINISLDNGSGIDGDINYKVHVQNLGWTDFCAGGENAGTEGEALRLEAIQIKLTGELADNYDVAYRVHVQNYGWTGWSYNGAIAGTEGEALRLEAIQIKILNKGEKIPYVISKAHVENYGWMSECAEKNICGTTGEALRVEALTFRMADGNGGIKYQAHVQNYGWTSWEQDGGIIGTTKEAKRLEAVKIELTGNVVDIYDIYYKVHVENYGWLDWAKNGEVAGTTGMSRRVEAIKVALVKKGENAPGNTDIPCVETPDIEYCAHVQNIGWQSKVANGVLAGTENKDYRLEAVRININNSTINGGIAYRTHIQDIGWSDWSYDDNISGTVGKSKRVEAIEVKLTGELADYFDVYYCSNIQNVGWLDWARNGETSGSTGIGMRLEALKVCLVAKGNSAPGSTSRHYVDSLGRTGVYTIKVNKLMNVVTIYDGDVPIRACICSAGNPTPIGTFYTPAKYRWKVLIGGVWGQYSTRITEGYLFHSVPYYTASVYAMNPISYNKLGITTSAGCVRLLVGDAKWIYDNCPLGTKVEVYESEDPGPLGKPTAPPLPPGQNWDPTDPEA